jgi:ABC-type multidrug transport system fused ATPase/permease subunit
VELSGVGNYVDKFDKGLDTEVGEGPTISGGEKQRIGIARALIRDPRILILDEATANLDPDTEEGILASIEQIRAGRTVLSVAHRLKAVVPCDRILVLNEGQIVQMGPHCELVERDGLYRKLWLEQVEA